MLCHITRVIGIVLTFLYLNVVALDENTLDDGFSLSPLLLKWDLRSLNWGSDASNVLCNPVLFHCAHGRFPEVITRGCRI